MESGYPHFMADGTYSRQQGLQSPRRPRRWLRAAGVVVLLVLIGLFVTSLFRSPNPIWTPITGVVALFVAAMLVRSLRRRDVGR